MYFHIDITTEYIVLQLATFHTLSVDCVIDVDAGDQWQYLYWQLAVGVIHLRLLNVDDFFKFSVLR